MNVRDEKIRNDLNDTLTQAGVDVRNLTIESVDGQLILRGTCPRASSTRRWSACCKLLPAAWSRSTATWDCSRSPRATRPTGGAVRPSRGRQRIRPTKAATSSTAADAGRCSPVVPVRAPGEV